MKFCNNCGKQVIESSKFCKHCGNKMPESDITSEQNKKISYVARSGKSPINEAKALANKEILQGFLWFIIGTIITVGGYMFASPGGTYFILWGAIIYGAYRLIRGFIYRINPDSLLAKSTKNSNL